MSDTALITVIMDRSGSMRPLQGWAIEAFNDYLAQQCLEGSTRWTLTLFDTKVTTPFVAIPGREVVPLDVRTYQPGGMTALYDAVGRTLDRTKRWIHHQPKPDRPDSVVVVIITDGLENASRHWSQPQVTALIRRLEDRGWQFVFMGADQDSWAVGHSLGIQRGVTVDWSRSRASMRAAMAEANEATIDYRRTQVQQQRHRDHR